MKQNVESYLYNKNVVSVCKFVLSVHLLLSILEILSEIGVKTAEAFSWNLWYVKTLPECTLFNLDQSSSTWENVIYL